jgi:TPR repeat protein
MKLIYLHIAADQLYSSSSYYLGMIYFVDVMVKYHIEKARYYLTNAFGGGHSYTGALLDYINKKKTDEKAIFERVFEWHKSSHDKSRAKISYNLGIMYYKGLGTRKDDNKAVSHLEKAANQGYVDAQLQLGEIYQNGHGTDQDWKKRSNGTPKQRIKTTQLLTIISAKYTFLVIVIVL